MRRPDQIEFTETFLQLLQDPAVSLTNVHVTGLGPGMDWQMGPSEDSVAITTSPTTPPGAYALSLVYSINGAQQSPIYVIRDSGNNYHRIHHYSVNHLDHCLQLFRLCFSFHSI